MQLSRCQSRTAKIACKYFVVFVMSTVVVDVDWEQLLISGVLRNEVAIVFGGKARFDIFSEFKASKCQILFHPLGLLGRS